MNISIKNLSYKYPLARKDILKNITLSFDKPGIYCLLGLNGSGKTTLIKCLAGLIKPQSGTIHIDDKDYVKMSVKEKSKYIAYVSQKLSNIEGLIVRDYLSFSFVNRLKFNEQPSKEEIELLYEYAKRLNISHLLDKKINEVSGGERQIISICSALLQDSMIIILDEPTSALDLKNQSLVLSVLKDIINRENKFIILSTHNPNHALYLDSKVIMIENGNVLRFGTAFEIINKEVLKEIYGNNICISKDLGYDEISFL